MTSYFSRVSITRAEEADIAALPEFLWGRGSRPGKSPNHERHRVYYGNLLFKDFWGDHPVYTPTHFRKFFKLPIDLFDEMVVKVVAHDAYFRQKQMQQANLVFHRCRKFVPKFDSSHQVLLQVRWMTSTVYPKLLR